MSSNIIWFIKAQLSSSRGNILVYIVMTMVIFGVLGVTMVSLFSTSISSTATQNDTRRAIYLSESGTRYAMSELLAEDFSKTATTNLNNTVYNVDQGGSFDLNLFRPWFEPETDIDLSPAFSNQSISFDVPDGHIPQGFVDRIPTNSPYLTIVNLDYMSLSGALNPPPYARAIVTRATNLIGLPPKLQLELSDDDDGDGFVASPNENVSFAVRPSSDQTVSLPGNLFIEPVAAKIFPYRNGAFEIKKRRFYYEKAIDHTSYVELTNVNPVKGENSSAIVATTNDDVILIQRNYFILSEGRSGDVTFGNRMDYAAAISNIFNLPPEDENPDIEFDKEADLPGVRVKSNKMPIS